MVTRDRNRLFLFILIPLVIVSGVVFSAVACGLAFAKAPSPFEEDATPDAPRMEVQTATPVPSTPTPLPDRTGCEDIRGTDYRSGAEREWYLANCLPTPTPTRVVPTPQPPPVPSSEKRGERWILVDIPTQTAKAMIGNEAVYTALVTTGKEGWETPKGTWRILRRVANETMTSESIGAEDFYVLNDVLYTQYFTNEAHALHLNYWRTDDYFGTTPSTHGCVGMRLADAEFFWNFATIGTRVVVQ